MQFSDSHNDFLSVLPKQNYFSYLSNCEQNGVKNLLCSAFTSEMKPSLAADFVRESAFVVRAFGNNNYRLHIEDLGYAKNIKEVEYTALLKPFSCSLTWNGDNQFAGGNFGINSLSKNGIAVIKIIQERGIFLDTAHLNRKSFYAATKFITTPLFCSHTGLNFIKKSPRNLSDQQVKTICDSGGYVGLFLSPTFFSQSGRMDCELFAKIIYKTFCKFGDNNFGLGSDFFGISKSNCSIEQYRDFECVATSLAKLGVGKESIDKFFYGNFVKFVSKTK